MKDNLRNEDSEFGNFGVRVQDIPTAETYITPKGVHQKLQSWECRVSRVREADQIVAIIEIILLGFLLQQANIPNVNNIQKALALWLMINRTIITAIFQYQMKKMEVELGKQICSKGSNFNAPSLLPEVVGAITAIGFNSSFDILNRTTMMAYIVFPILGIELITLCLRIMSRIALASQALAITTAHQTALEGTKVLK